MMDRYTEIIQNAYAKINLTLDILGVKADGYHELQSVMQTISLHDIITIKPGNQGIYIVCSDPAIPVDSRNLAYRAAEHFCFAAGIPPEFEIILEKYIPNQAGLGGGSSDAAAVLIMLNKMYDEPLAQNVLNSVSARIGSDVPFFIRGGTASIGGRGECIEALPDIPRYHLVIVKPRFGISTAWAYKRLDEMRGIGIAEMRAVTHTDRLAECIKTGDWDQLPCLIANDLEQPSIDRHPEIDGIKNRMLQLGAKGALMCGSGSAVFGIFGSNEEAVSASFELSVYGDVYVTQTIRPNDEADS